MRYVEFGELANTAILLAIASFAGCGGGTGTRGDAASAEPGHAHIGVHGGQVIDLGHDNYHVELVHDDATHTVGVLVLDGTAKQSAPVDASSVKINCIVNEQPVQFTLNAMPQPGDPPGNTSYFELKSEELCDGFDAPGAKSRLTIVISGKPYVGEIASLAPDHQHGKD